LGGDSILATRMMARVRDTFAVELAPRALFEAPTIARLAVAITQAMAEKAGAEELERELALMEALP
jgi:acyl carrier protein